jgi:hypothetical protein
MHTADILPAVFIGGVFLLLVGRLVSAFIKAKLA